LDKLFLHISRKLNALLLSKLQNKQLHFPRTTMTNFSMDHLVV